MEKATPQPEANMYEVEMEAMSPEFSICWQAAGNHLNRQAPGGLQSWLRAHPYPPFIEHFSFRLGNQLFFVRVEDADGKIHGPGTLEGLLAISDRNRGHACLLPMHRTLTGEGWAPVGKGWGLFNAVTNEEIDPLTLVTEEKIEMSSWEVHDMAVQVVREFLQRQGFKLMSWQGNPQVDPSIWFVGESTGPEWVVVRSTCFPENHAERPANWLTIARQCARLSNVGHFASVALVSADQPFQSSDEPATPLWRGHGMYVNFSGLE